MSRYAIYYAPASRDPLWTFGSSVLGYDAARGVRMGLPDHPLYVFANFRFHMTLSGSLRPENRERIAATMAELHAPRALVADASPCSGRRRREAPSPCWGGSHSAKQAGGRNQISAPL